MGDRLRAEKRRYAVSPRAFCLGVSPKHRCQSTQQRLHVPEDSSLSSSPWETQSSRLTVPKFYEWSERGMLVDAEVFVLWSKAVAGQQWRARFCNCGLLKTQVIWRNAAKGFKTQYQYSETSNCIHFIRVFVLGISTPCNEITNLWKNIFSFWKTVSTHAICSVVCLQLLV